MTRRWNGKSVVDELGARVWDNAAASLARIIGWANEIQDDLATALPMDYYKFELKKLLPVSQDIVSISPQIPTAATAAIAAGGSLTESSTYKVYISFLIYDEDGEDYIESEASVASGEVTADASNKTIDLTAIDTYDGDTTIKPATIYRRIYLAANAGSGYGEPLFIADIADNTTTTYSITAESSSTVTPVSDSEVSSLTSDHPRFTSSGRVLERIDRNSALRYSPAGSSSDTPDTYDLVGTRKIFLFPQLGSSATVAQRTLKYTVYRRPHEVFYDVDRKIDLPIEAKMALVAGIVWKSYEYRDRDRVQEKLGTYMELKAELVRKLTRRKGRPTCIRDVNGDTFGFEVK